VQQVVQSWLGLQVPPIVPQVSVSPHALAAAPQEGTQSRKWGNRSTQAPCQQYSQGMLVPHTVALLQVTASHRSSRTQDPPKHHSSILQRTPQSPQFSESVDVSTQAR
jgi:hypothetical protein